MAIGGDIKEVLAEVGTAFTILRSGGDISGEYLDYEPNRQVTKPFIREYFLEGVLSYDTEVTAGDIVEFDVTAQQYLVMNRTSDMLEDGLVNMDAVLYKTNVSGELFRPSGEEWDGNYRRQSAWTLVASGCYGLLTEKLFGTDLLQDEELGQIGVEAQVLYLPSSYEVQALDRYQPASGEFYKIEVVESRKFDNVDVCHVAEDTREY